MRTTCSSTRINAHCVDIICSSTNNDGGFNVLSTFCCSHEKAPGGRRSLQVGLFAAYSCATGRAPGLVTSVFTSEVLGAPLLPPVMVTSAQFL